MGDIKKGDPIAASIISGLFAKLETIRIKHADKGQESGVSPISWNRGVSDKINYSDDFNQIVTKTNQVYTGSKYLKKAHTYTEKNKWRRTIN